MEPQTARSQRSKHRTRLKLVEPGNPFEERSSATYSNPFELPYANRPEPDPPEPTRTLALTPSLPVPYRILTPEGRIQMVHDVDGERVVINDLGSIKAHAKHVLYEAALRSPQEWETEEYRQSTQQMSALQLAAESLAKRAAMGDAPSVTEFFDRIMGKPKQTIENQNINVTIDDILTQTRKELNIEGEGGE